MKWVNDDDTGNIEVFDLIEILKMRNINCLSVIRVLNRKGILMVIQKYTYLLNWLKPIATLDSNEIMVDYNSTVLLIDVPGKNLREGNCNRLKSIVDFGILKRVSISKVH